MKTLLTTFFFGFVFTMAWFGHKDQLYKNLDKQPRPWVTMLKYNIQSQKELQAGHYRKAIDACDHVLAIDPSAASTYTIRAIAKIKLANYSGAMDDVEQAIQLDSTQALAYAYRGSLKLGEGKIQQAQADIRQALVLDSTCVQAYNAHGFL